MASTAPTKSIFILPKPTPGSATLPGSIILTDTTTVLDSAKRLALNGSPSVTPSPLKSGSIHTPDSKCKRKLNFAKLGLPSDKHKSSPKSVEKRNARERNRVKTINGTFENLRDHLPCGDSVMQRKKQKKMSKVDILKGAIDYISMLKEMLEETDNLTLKASPPNSPGQPFTPSSISDVPSSPASHLGVQASDAYSSSVPSATSHLNLPGSPYRTYTPLKRAPHSPALHSPSIPSTPSTTSSYTPSSPYMPSSPAYQAPHHQSHQDPEEMSFIERMKLESGSFLAALADPAPVRNSQLLDPGQAPTSPAESLPGSTGSSSESIVSSSSPAPHLIPAHQYWDPDEDELKNLVSWFQ